MKLYLFFYYIQLAVGLQRIWFLRHCDKPHNKDNPCCSKKGYQRANNWHLYFQTWIPQTSRIAIYTSSFHEKKMCIQNTNSINTNKQCQKSQRMWITAQTIYNNLHIYFPFYKTIHSNFCIGEYKKVLQHIKKDALSFTDAIVIWEHTEIIEMIRALGIETKHVHNNIYHLVFLVDLQSKTLYYDYYSLFNESHKPILKLTTISDYFETTLGHKKENNIIIFLSKLLLPSFIFLVLCYVLFYLFCCQSIRSQYQEIP